MTHFNSFFHLDGYYLGRSDAMAWAYLFVFICMLVNVWILYLLFTAYRTRLISAFVLSLGSLILTMVSAYLRFASRTFNSLIIELYMPLALAGIFFSCLLLRRRQLRFRRQEENDDIIYNDIAGMIQNIMTFFLCVLIWFCLFVCVIKILNANQIYDFHIYYT